MTNLIKDIEENIHQLKQWRHDLHQHPELSFDEHRTSKKVAGYLKLIGVDEIHTGIGKTGVVGILKNGAGPSIGLRADMDALPIQETAPHNYSSTNKNTMHACGHDGHVVMLLGAAKYLTNNRTFKGTIILIFQPAEELIEGAAAMLKDGLLEKFPFDSIYTLHSWPGATTNQMFANIGPVMASVNNFEIHIKCSGGHAAMPQLSPDPIIAGCAIVTNLQTIVSRRIAPSSQVVISCTVFNGGTVYNVIPNEVIIKGTARFVDSELRKWLPKKMNQIIEGIARAHDVQAEFNYQTQCPPTYNTETEALLANSVIKELLGENNAKSKSVSMGSDDFCFYLDEVPGAYVFIGNGIDSACLHHSAYDFNDDALAVGASFYAKLVEANSLD